MSSVGMAQPSFWQNFRHTLAAEFVKLEAALKPLEDKFKVLIKAGADELGTLALNAVATEAPKLISGQEKLQNATANIINSLASQGKTVGAAVAQAAAQDAYDFIALKLKGSASQ